MKKAVLGLFVAAMAFAGTPLLCNADFAKGGPIFQKLEPLRKIAIESDDSPEKGRVAQAKLAELRAKAKSGAAEDLVLAGYLTAGLHRIRQTTESDGITMLERAAALRPEDAEIQTLLAMAYADKDKSKAQQHLTRAHQLAKQGTGEARNLEMVSWIFGK